jgi:hypothetical protein
VIEDRKALQRLDFLPVSTDCTNKLYNFRQYTYIWAHKTSLTLPIFIKVPEPSQESECSCICMLGLLILPQFQTFLC